MAASAVVLVKMPVSNNAESLNGFLLENWLVLFIGWRQLRG
jgi:hypothetical protein